MTIVSNCITSSTIFAKSKQTHLRQGEKVKNRGPSQNCVIILISIQTNNYETKKHKKTYRQSRLSRMEDKNAKSYNSKIT